MNLQRPNANEATKTAESFLKYIADEWYLYSLSRRVHREL